MRKGETISSKLFTLPLDDTFKNIKWDTKGIKIEEEYLSHLCFEDDILVFCKQPTGCLGNAEQSHIKAQKR